MIYGYQKSLMVMFRSTLNVIVIFIFDSATFACIFPDFYTLIVLLFINNLKFDKVLVLIVKH